MRRIYVIGRTAEEAETCIAGSNDRFPRSEVVNVTRPEQLWGLREPTVLLCEGVEKHPLWQEFERRLRWVGARFLSL